MILTMINTHKAYLALQNAGVADKQAEVMVEIFAEMQQENSLTKADLSQAMEGVVRMQHATNNRMDAMEERNNHFEKEVKNQFSAIDIRFDKVDQRFEKIDQRFEKIDQRFEKIDKRFDQMDEKFDKIDIRFGNIDQTLAALKNDSHWLKGILMVMVCTMITATARFMFIS
ncbi:hypothetical protein [Pantoea sp.]|uniref:hypothetical protein n=1 Tax=Pantoea sp. TaxID=69393 RepID=UPI0031CE10CC